jgi:hypothetical protein
MAAVYSQGKFKKKFKIKYSTLLKSVNTNVNLF